MHSYEKNVIYMSEGDQVFILVGEAGGPSGGWDGSFKVMYYEP